MCTVVIDVKGKPFVHLFYKASLIEREETYYCGRSFNCFIGVEKSKKSVCKIIYPCLVL